MLCSLIIVSRVFAIVGYQMFFEIRGKTLANSFLSRVEGVNIIVAIVGLGPFVSWQSVLESKLHDMMNQSALVLLSLTCSL